MSAVLKINELSSSRSETDTDAAAGLTGMPPGRVALVARCLGEVEPLLVEKRNHAIAIKIRGRWYAVEPAGTFRARICQSDGRVVEIAGGIRQALGRLTLEAVESVLTTGECKRWHAVADLSVATEARAATSRH